MAIFFLVQLKLRRKIHCVLQGVRILTCCRHIVAAYCIASAFLLVFEPTHFLQRLWRGTPEHMKYESLRGKGGSASSDKQTLKRINRA